METTCGLVRASSASSSTSASSGDRPHLPLSSDLQAALEDVWQACLQLPTDSPSFEALSPDERRQAHDLGVQIQDRLLISLSRLVEGMTTDGVELVGEGGVLRAFTEQPVSAPPEQG